jgi:predicted nucleic-acid-binding protein
LAKISLLLPEIFAQGQSEEHSEMANTLSNIAKMACDDNNIQVYQSGLVLLDALLLQCEENELPQSKVTSLLSNTVTDILTKLADGSKKVADSAELSLLAMAHSSCVGVGYICNASTKKVRTADLKGGRAIKARLQFLDHLIAEFGDEVMLKRVLDFVKSSKAFDHKDVGVREAAKAVILTLMVVHGDNLVLQSFEDCSERQYNEYRAKYSAIMRSVDGQLIQVM